MVERVDSDDNRDAMVSEPLGDAITVLEAVNITDPSARPDTEDAHNRVNLALAYLRMVCTCRPGDACSSMACKGMPRSRTTTFCETDDYPGAVWHRCARLADSLGEFSSWLKETGADVHHDPVEAARLCADRWDGLDLAAIAAALSEARTALGLLIGDADA